MEFPKEIEELMTIAVKEATHLEAEAIEPVHLFIAACRLLEPTLVSDSFHAHGIDPKRLRRRLRAIARAECPKHADGPRRVSRRVMNALDSACVWSHASGYPFGIGCLLISLLEYPDGLLQKAYSSDSLPTTELVIDLVRRLTEAKAGLDSSQSYEGPASDNEGPTSDKRASQRRGSERRAKKTPTEPEPTKSIVPYEPTEPPRQARLEHPYTPTLDFCGNDYTAMAREGRIDPIIGRSDEIKRVIRILLQKQKNNPALLGDAGVGKTSIVEGLALRVAAEDAPREIRDWRIVELLLTALVAGTTYRGELEEKLRQIMLEVKSDKHLILFIDELHTLIGAGSAIGTLDIASILKPALARGQMRVIGATTTAEYRRYIEKDPALERRFQPVRIKEPTPAQAREILEGLRPIYESHHGVKITDEALDAAIEFSVEYLTDRRLPDKARDLVDQASVMKRFISMTPGKLKKGTPEVGREDIAEMVAEWVGIPIERLFFKANQQPHTQLDEALRRRVIGQDEAIAEVSSAVRTALAGLAQPERPSGVFLFMGPTGVGKTELAKALAEYLFGDERRLIRFDMSEYMEEHSAAKLIGAPPGYVGHEDGGLLINAVRTNPYSVLLFDEMEKAHPRISDLFLQVFDDGRLTDSNGQTADFRNTIIILTTNLRSTVNDEKKQKRFGFRVSRTELNESDEDKRGPGKATQDELRTSLLTHFRPELINRINKIVQFNPLRAVELRVIIDKLVDRVRLRLKDKKLELQLTPQAYDALTQVGYKPEWGARELERIIEHQIVEPLAHGLLDGQFKAGETIYVVPADDGVAVTNQKPG